MNEESGRVDASGLAALVVPLVRLAGRVAPTTTAKVVLDKLYTVPGAARHPRSAPLCGGADFTASFEGHVVRGTSWGQGALVYLVHGWAGGADQWTPLVHRLAAAGFRVVTFDAPSHGASDPGPLGPNRSNGVEFGKALDAVATVHGPAYAVVAHSLGAMATMLTLRYGWLSTQKLVFVAPMTDLRSHLDRMATTLGLGRRVRDKIDSVVEAQTRIAVDDCDVVMLAQHTDTAPLLIVHDLDDRRAPVAASAAAVRAWPTAASLVTTEGLGHSRLLAATPVHDRILEFLGERPDDQPQPTGPAFERSSTS